MLLRLLFGRGAAQSTPSRPTRSAPTVWARPTIEFLEGRLAPSDLVDSGLVSDPTQTPVGANLPAISTVAPPIQVSSPQVSSPVATPSSTQGVLPQSGSLLAALTAGSPVVASETQAAAATIDAGFTEASGNTYSIVGEVSAANVNGYTVSFSGIPELQGRVVKVNADGSFGTSFGCALGGASTRTVNVALIAPGGSTCAQCQVSIHQSPDLHP
jgi:hypothetical protein